MRKGKEGKRGCWGERRESKGGRGAVREPVISKNQAVLKHPKPHRRGSSPRRRPLPR